MFGKEIEVVPCRGKRTQRDQRGAALILVLILIAVVSVIAAGIGTLIMSHYSRATTDQYALRALNAADAAADFQVQRIYSTLNSSGANQLAYNGSNLNSGATYGMRANPMPVTSKTYNNTSNTLNNYLNLSTGASTPDYAQCWVEYSWDSTKAFDPNYVLPDGHVDSNGIPDHHLYVYGQAQVSGIYRIVRSEMHSGGLFNYNNDKMAIFGISTGNPSASTKGSFSTIDPATGLATGAVGSNGTISIQKPASVAGQIVFGSGTPDPDFPATYGGPTIVLPTIDQLANDAYAAGAYPSTASTGILKFKGATATATNNDNQAYAKDGSGNPITATGNYNLKNNTLNLTNPGTKTGGVTNFYISTGLGGANIVINADVTNGPINLWIDGSGKEMISGNPVIAAFHKVGGVAQPPSLADSAKFHLYYNNPPTGDLTITGGGSYYVMFYVYNTNAANPNGYGTVQTQGNTLIYGSLYAYAIDQATGNTTVVYPTTQLTGTTATQPWYFIGLSNAWQEYNPVQGN